MPTLPVNDNRHYDYAKQGFYVREEFPIISRWIKPGSKIIDLGCGNGSLMHYLRENNNEVEVSGIESAESGVHYGKEQGLNINQSLIDQEATYQPFGDKVFDYAVCNVSLQMVMYPEVLLTAMRRIAHQQIISFPNFAYIGNRLDLLFRGRMPRPMLHGYSWFNTGHVHQLSIADFKELCDLQGLKITEQKHFGCLSFIANWFWPNLFSKEALFLCESK